MGFYFRTFAKKTTFPKVGTIQKWLAEAGSRAILDDVQHALEAMEKGLPFDRPKLNARMVEWPQIAVAYKQGKLPILAEYVRDDGSPKNMVRAEVADSLN